MRRSNKKIRNIPPKENTHSYMMYLHTVGTTKASINLMENIAEEYSKGNNYFNSLKIINDYCTVLNQLELFTNSHLKRSVEKLCFDRYKQEILVRKFPPSIESFSLNVLHTFHKKFNPCPNSLGKYSKK